ncbi:MAG TPA: hypothetical protein VIM42_12280 [Clostridium sp.]
MEKLFYCYSLPLKRFLVGNGVRYLHSGTHRKTLKTFYVFIGTDKLNCLLQQWRSV